MTTTLVNSPVSPGMNMPAANDEAVIASRGDVAAKSRSEVASTPRSDVLFLLSNLAVGGSERKITRLANRLKEEGTAVSLACLNFPYTLEASVRRDVPVHKLDRRGKFSFSAMWKLRKLIRSERPATVVAVNLYQALYVAGATLLMARPPRTVALVNTSTF
jgi:hypothetical protein